MARILPPVPYRLTLENRDETAVPTAPTPAPVRLTGQLGIIKLGSTGPADRIDRGA